MIGMDKADTVPVDAAALRAGVGDDRYWRTAHPENSAWRAWVTDGFKTLYAEGREPGGVVHVRAYMRDGHMVSAHTRSAPPSHSGGDQPGQSAWPSGFDRRLSLLEPENIVPVARRPDRPRGPLGGDVPTPMDPPWGGGAGSPGSGGPRAAGPRPAGPAPSSPEAIARSRQELIEMVAPGGIPIGRRIGDAKPHTRTVEGGEEGARGFFRRIIENRSPQDVTPAGHSGQMVRLNDGSIISFRPASGADSGVAAIDIKIPG